MAFLRLPCLRFYCPENDVDFDSDTAYLFIVAYSLLHIGIPIQKFVFPVIIYNLIQHTVRVQHIDMGYSTSRPIMYRLSS